MAERPECPYCGAQLTESVPIAVEGAIRVRCQECDSIYTFTNGIGSFPIEDDLGLHISAGLFRAQVSIGQSGQETSGRSCISPKSNTYICICVLVIIITIGIILMFIE